MDTAIAKNILSMNSPYFVKGKCEQGFAQEGDLVVKGDAVKKGENMPHSQSLPVSPNVYTGLLSPEFGEPIDTKSLYQRFDRKAFELQLSTRSVNKSHHQASIVDFSTCIDDLETGQTKGSARSAHSLSVRNVRFGDDDENHSFMHKPHPPAQSLNKTNMSLTDLESPKASSSILHEYNGFTSVPSAGTTKTRSATIKRAHKAVSFDDLKDDNNHSVLFRSMSFPSVSTSQVSEIIDYDSEKRHEECTNNTFSVLMDTNTTTRKQKNLTKNDFRNEKATISEFETDEFIEQLKDKNTTKPQHSLSWGYDSEKLNKINKQIRTREGSSPIFHLVVRGKGSFTTSSNTSSCTEQKNNQSFEHKNRQNSHTKKENENKLLYNISCDTNTTNNGSLLKISQGPNDASFGFPSLFISPKDHSNCISNQHIKRGLDDNDLIKRKTLSKELTSTRSISVSTTFPDTTHRTTRTYRTLHVVGETPRPKRDALVQLAKIGRKEVLCRYHMKRKKERPVKPKVEVINEIVSFTSSGVDDRM